MSSTARIAGSENRSAERPPVTPPAAPCAISVRGLAKTYDGGIEAVKGIDAEAMTTRKPTLDDVCLQLTGSRLAA